MKCKFIHRLIWISSNLLGVLSCFLCVLHVVLPSSAWGKNIYIGGGSVNYCTGKNGILMVGKQATQCCTYLSSKTSGLEGDDGANIPAAALSNSHIGTPVPTPPTGANCPIGGSVTTDTYVHAYAGNDLTANLILTLGALSSGAAGINGSAAPAARATPDTTAPGDYSQNGPSGSAASAGDSKDWGVPSALKAMLPTSLTSKGNTGNSGKNGGGVGANSTGVSALAGGDAGVEPSAAPTRDTQSNPGNTIGSSYSAGGGGKDGSGSSGDFRGLAGGSASGISIEGGESPNSLEFGANGNSIPAMGTSDPEDYFTRTNIDEDLFKKVHKRYGATTSKWAIPF